MPATAEPGDEVARRAREALAAVVPPGRAAETIARHGERVRRAVGGAGDAVRALAVAASLHEIGRFVPGRGHHAARSARWVAINLDRILPDATPEERRLAGELILFHRHRGALPPELSRPDLIDRFRRAEEEDLAGAGSRDPLRAVLRRSDLLERLRHPLATPRVTRIHRPDR